LLDIDRDLVDNKEADIRVMFEKYVAIQSAYDKIRTIDWKARGYNKPSIKRDIIAIFIGKSQYHAHWDPIFKKVIQHWPQMKQWLEEDTKSKPAEQVWGIVQDKFTLKDLEMWMKHNGTLNLNANKEVEKGKERENEGESSKKGKEKEQVQIKDKKKKKKKASNEAGSSR